MASLSYGRFEDEICDVFNDAGIKAFRLVDHFTKRLMGHASGPNVQLDVIAKCGQTILIIEPTTQKDQLQRYVKKKIENFERVWNSPNGLVGALMQDPEHFGLNRADAQQFDGLTDYRHIIVGPYLEQGDFSLVGGAPPRTYIWGGETIVYFKMLVNAIEHYAQGEIVNSIGMNIADVATWTGTPGPVRCDALKARDSALFQSGVPADIYVFTIRPEDLLYLATVRRVESPGELAYQRLPDKNRLPKIKSYIEESEIKFLNNLIITIPESTTFHNGKLDIQRIPYSCEIVDGQHRLYAYSKVSTAIRSQDRLIVTGVRFLLGDDPHIRKAHLLSSLKESGRIFININGEQRKVSSTILNNVKAFLLKEDCKETHAIEILSRLNTKARTKNVFAMKTFQRGVRTPSLVRSHFSFHFDPIGDIRHGRGIIYQNYQQFITRSTSANDYNLYYSKICDDIYDFIRRALDNLNYPADWSNQRGYNSLACIGGILRSFRFFRHENYYWSDRNKIDEVFSQLIVRKDIPQIFDDLPLGGAGPKKFETMIIKTADRSHQKGLKRLGWLT